MDQIAAAVAVQVAAQDEIADPTRPEEGYRYTLCVGHEHGLARVENAVEVAVAFPGDDLASVEQAVHVAVERGVGRDLATVEDSVHVAVQCAGRDVTGVERPVAVAVGGRIGGDLARVVDPVAVAIGLAAIDHAVLIAVFGEPEEELGLVGDLVAVAVGEQAIGDVHRVVHAVHVPVHPPRVERAPIAAAAIDDVDAPVGIDRDRVRFSDAAEGIDDFGAPGVSRSGRDEYDVAIRIAVGADVGDASGIDRDRVPLSHAPVESGQVDRPCPVVVAERVHQVLRIDTVEAHVGAARPVEGEVDVSQALPEHHRHFFDDPGRTATIRVAQRMIAAEVGDARLVELVDLDVDLPTATVPEVDLVDELREVRGDCRACPSQVGEAGVAVVPVEVGNLLVGVGAIDRDVRGGLIDDRQDRLDGIPLRWQGRAEEVAGETGHAGLVPDAESTAGRGVDVHEAERRGDALVDDDRTVGSDVHGLVRIGGVLDLLCIADVETSVRNDVGIDPVPRIEGVDPGGNLERPDQEVTGAGRTGVRQQDQAGEQGQEASAHEELLGGGAECALEGSFAIGARNSPPKPTMSAPRGPAPWRSRDAESE